MTTKRSISDDVRGIAPSFKTAKEFLDAIRQKFKVSNKVDFGNLMSNFTNAEYDNTGGIKDYIMRIVQIATRLKELNVPVASDFLVHHVLNSLPMKFE